MGARLEGGGWPEGFRDPDLKDGNVDASGCVSLPPSHLLVIPLEALKTWETWSDDIKIPLLEAAGSGCDVFVTRPTRNGIPRMHIAFGNCARRPMV